MDLIAHAPHSLLIDNAHSQTTPKGRYQCKYTANTPFEASRLHGAWRNRIAKANFF
jgi:hypothetical protein